jgi:hypothetical protein
MLAQSSDWPLMIRSGVHVEHALESVERHLRVSSQILDDLERGVVPSVDSSAIAAFSDLDLSALSPPAHDGGGSISHAHASKP